MEGRRTNGNPPLTLDVIVASTSIDTVVLTTVVVIIVLILPILLPPLPHPYFYFGAYVDPAVKFVPTHKINPILSGEPHHHNYHSQQPHNRINIFKM